MNILNRTSSALFEQIPIIINNRNRLTTLLNLIESLEKRGCRNIYIIDNNSTYPQLIDYYDNKCRYKVFRLKENFGPNALWDSNIIKKFKSNYFVYTDSDIVLDDNCPNNLIEVLLAVLEKYHFVHKCGPSLKIDDLPDYYSNKDKVIKWETQFWEEKENNLKQRDYNLSLYKAHIDTTFALHRPFSPKNIGIFYKQVRLGYPYVAKHMPWYVDSSHETEEEKYYASHASSSSTWCVKKQ